MKIQKHIKSIFTILVLLTSGLVIGCSHTPEAKAKRVVKKIDRHLDLNDQQKAELNKLKDEALADFHAMKAEHEALANEIQRQLESGKLDRALLKKIAADQRSKRAPTTDKWIDNIVTFYESLSAEQKETVLKDMKKFRSEMRD